MEALQFNHTILLGIIITMSIYLGWLFTETRHNLAQKHWLLNRKPFSCRPCLTFHLGWILSAMAGYITDNLTVWVCGAALSLIVWLILEIETRNKIDD